jgi:hypothetical protein
MFVQYLSKNGAAHPRYVCLQERSHYGGPACQGLSAPCVDDAVCELALAALTPAAVELSLRAAEDLERDRKATDDHWQGRLERARYEAVESGNSGGFDPVCLAGS